MHEWCVVFHCLLGVEDTGKRFPIHFNEIDGLLGDIGIDGRHGGDFLADIAGFADGKYVLIGDESSPGTFDGVFRRTPARTPRSFAAYWYRCGECAARG